jgi:putative FmdB family regulatory protein
MPFYEYECARCGQQTEAMQKVSDPPLRKCPACGKSALRKLMSAPVFRLKGSGWYETDFKTDKDQKRNLAGDEPAEKGDAKADTKAESKVDGGTDAKSEAKTETKAEAKAEPKADTKTAKTSTASSKAKRTAKTSVGKSAAAKTRTAKPKAGQRGRR